MAAGIIDSSYDRFHHVVADRYGIDPLKDRVLPGLISITSYKPHTVTQDERGAPDLIAMRMLGTEKLWWVILAYNGIASYRDIVEGTSLRIPDLNSVVAVITAKSMSSTNTPSIITI